MVEGCEKGAICEGELLRLGCGWRPVKGDEEVVSCVEAETPLLARGDEDGGGWFCRGKAKGGKSERETKALGSRFWFVFGIGEREKY
jgi:hypothetical protein